jgi:translation initiation factor 1
MTSRDRDHIVYSSTAGRLCPNCAQPLKRCACRASPRAERGDGIVSIRREVKGRRGKAVTTLSGIPLAQHELRALAAELKRLCGAGGASKHGIIEIQGDHRDALVAELEARGYRVRRAGG